MLANLVADDGTDGDAARAVLAEAGDAAIPDLADVETLAVLRKRWLAGTLDNKRLAEAVEDLGALPFRRWPALPLVRRTFELRANLTAYDAVYVALAEGLDCPLVTADARLGRAPGLNCPVTILRMAGG